MGELQSIFSDIADAIRAKNGSSDTYLPNEMAQAILDIPSGGSGIVDVLTNGQVSTSSAYHSETFNDISNMQGGVVIRLRDTVSGTDYVGYCYVPYSEIPAENNYILRTISVHTNVQVKITRTSIEGTNYSGSYYPIYVDIVGIQNSLF